MVNKREAIYFIISISDKWLSSFFLSFFLSFFIYKGLLWNAATVTKRGACVLLLDSFTVMFGATIAVLRVFSLSLGALTQILGALTQISGALTQIPGAFIIMIGPNVTLFGAYCTLLGANSDVRSGVIK